MTSTRSKGSKKPLTEEELELLQQQVQKQQERLLQESKAFEKAQEEFAREREKLHKQEDTLAREQLTAAKYKELNSQLQRELEELHEEVQAQKLRQSNTMDKDEAIQEFQQRLELLNNDIREIKMQTQHEEDVRILCTEKEESAPGISLREVLATVPTFNGYNVSLSRFTNACKRARDLLPRSNHDTLLKLLVNKLYGRAYIAVEEEAYKNVDALLDILTSTFGENKTTDQYRGELSSIYLKPGEHILDYIGRTKALYSAIIDSNRRDGNKYPNPEELNGLTIRAFYNGLPRTYKLEMQPQEYFSPLEAYSVAKRIFRDLETERQRYGQPTREKEIAPSRHTEDKTQPNHNLRDNDGHKGYQQQGNWNKSAPTSVLPRSPKFCPYCRKTGHIIDECFIKRRAEQGNGQGPARTNAPHTDFDKSRSKQITPINKDKEKVTIKKNESRASTSKTP